MRGLQRAVELYSGERRTEPTRRGGVPNTCTTPTPNYCAVATDRVLLEARCDGLPPVPRPWLYTDDLERTDWPPGPGLWVWHDMGSMLDHGGEYPEENPPIWRGIWLRMTEQQASAFAAGTPPWRALVEAQELELVRMGEALVLAAEARDEAQTEAWVNSQRLGDLQREEEHGALSGRALYELSDWEIGWTDLDAGDRERWERLAGRLAKVDQAGALLGQLDETSVQLRGLAGEVDEALTQVERLANGMASAKWWLADSRPAEEKVRALAFLLGLADEQNRADAGQAAGLDGTPLVRQPHQTINGWHVVRYNAEQNPERECVVFADREDGHKLVLEVADRLDLTVFGPEGESGSRSTIGQTKVRRARDVEAATVFALKVADRLISEQAELARASVASVSVQLDVPVAISHAYVYGRASSYDRALAAGPVHKTGKGDQGRDADYPGGHVYRTYADAAHARPSPLDYGIYEVELPGSWDECTYWVGHVRHLLVDARIVGRVDAEQAVAPEPVQARPHVQAFVVASMARLAELQQGVLSQVGAGTAAWASELDAQQAAPEGWAVFVAALPGATWEECVRSTDDHPGFGWLRTPAKILRVADCSAGLVPTPPVRARTHAATAIELPELEHPGTLTKDDVASMLVEVPR